MSDLFNIVKEDLQDYSSENEIRIHLGDTLDFCKGLPNGYANLIVTSPPYNIGKEYETRVGIHEYLNKQRGVIQELYRILADDGSICWEVGNYVEKGEVYPLDIYYYDIFKDCNFKLRNRIVWYFGHGLHTQKRFSGRYEIMLWFTKSENYKFFLDPVRVPNKYPGKRHYRGEKKGQPSANPLGKNPSDIWEIISEEWNDGMWDIPNVKSNHPEKTEHPCQFPIELVERTVLALTQEGDRVFDPYSGVGSSLIAAIKNNRKATGCEKEDRYINITKQRIKDFYEGRLKIRPLGKPVFIPTGNEKVSQIPNEWKENFFNNNTEE